MNRINPKLLENQAQFLADHEKLKQDMIDSYAERVSDSIADGLKEWIRDATLAALGKDVVAAADANIQEAIDIVRAFSASLQIKQTVHKKKKGIQVMRYTMWRLEKNCGHIDFEIGTLSQ